MKILNIRISEWRHFKDIEIAVPEDAPVVCLVGGNGTGKSQIMELIAAAAQRVGLTEGYSGYRGDPFNEESDVEITFQVAVGLFPNLEILLEKNPSAIWDRTLTVRKKKYGATEIVDGNGSSDHHAFLREIIGAIRQSASVHYMMLDADRAYPRIEVQTHQIGEAFQTDWSGSNKSKSYLMTKSLYEEWFRYLLGTENQENNKHISEIRIARERHKKEPKFVDKMEGYRDSIKSVLPHLLFTGINSQTRQVKFDSTGIDLTFDQLSGGEREIAFLIGQIERFGLRRGLLLVDEPELHLNNDLLRSWIGFLKGSVEQGQIWLASHSVEVVEVTGQAATFVLERNKISRKVDSCQSLGSRPVAATLSRALGSPAFSISSVKFVLLEGEAEIGERERFRILCGERSDTKFIESGSCGEVIRRLDGLRSIAAASGEELKVGGIIDRDWRGVREIEELEGIGLHVLGVHEVENLFLHPPTLKAIMKAIYADSEAYEAKLALTTDVRAGSWIFDAARTDRAFRDFPTPSEDARRKAHEMRWSDFSDISSGCAALASSDAQLDVKQTKKLETHLVTRAKTYERIRQSDDLWKRCEGKEIFRQISRDIGFSDPRTAEAAVLGYWKDNPELLPKELMALRSYVGSLSPQ